MMNGKNTCRTNKEYVYLQILLVGVLLPIMSFYPDENYSECSVSQPFDFMRNSHTIYASLTKARLDNHKQLPSWEFTLNIYFYYIHSWYFILNIEGTLLYLTLITSIRNNVSFTWQLFFSKNVRIKKRGYSILSLQGNSAVTVHFKST